MKYLSANTSGKKQMKWTAITALCASLSSFSVVSAINNTEKSNADIAPTKIVKAQENINIDAAANEASWKRAQWRELDQILIGGDLTKADFQGRYKLLWDEEALYLLFELKDDVLADTHPDPLVNYWEDDCVEVFIDEDASGGDHQFNYNAFAYHVGLDRNVSDMGPTASSSESKIQTYNDHIQSQWYRSADDFVITWELKISIFDDTYLPNSGAKAVTLEEGKRMGFMLAYCDADGQGKREHFIGSYPIEGINGDKNLGYKTADVFEKVQLVK